MATKFLELSKNRLAIIEYYWKANENGELFKKLKENDIIPFELWNKKPHRLDIEFLGRDEGSISNVYNVEDTYLIFNAVNSIKPPTDVTVGEYFS